jgi:hypothetical protein
LAQQQCAYNGAQRDSKAFTPLKALWLRDRKAVADGVVSGALRLLVCFVQLSASQLGPDFRREHTLET